jgi:hypothetical protein
MSIATWTDLQLSEAKSAAALLPLNRQDKFIRGIAGMLADKEHPTDGDVDRDINLILSQHGVAQGHSSWVKRSPR